jgi:phage shock protein PspC (stress-responsive transcriptional regulator)
MWAGVAGGIAEYLDVDPTLIRLTWAAAAIVTGGLAIPAYIVLWIVMPRDDQESPAMGRDRWAAWTDEFQRETRRIAEEARHMAESIGEHGQPDQGDTPASPGHAEQSSSAPPHAETAASTVGEAPREPASASSARPSSGYGPGGYAPPGWAGPPPPRNIGRRQRSAGLILVVLGLLFLASQYGVFAWINWRMAWPLILVLVGLGLVFRERAWRH